ncbi:hypothetical protein QYF61_025471 [Mycteria americana]|uniref:Uncharacterized protein n=1 Tax=Mycteria americana TaxID=33587 RepID=A0AAN7RLZ8_MYCAM|nr:hypothetical protein QYF61_025471 [Mycteria americana]
MPLGLLLALLGYTMALDPALEEAWEGWKSLHAKEYSGEAEAARREVWENNLRRIQQHNREESQGQHTFRLAMNHYGDLALIWEPGTPRCTQGLIWELGTPNPLCWELQVPLGLGCFPGVDRLVGSRGGAGQTDKEFNWLLNGFTLARQEELVPLFQASAVLKTPVEVDWRAKGYVTPVKNQVGTGPAGAARWVPGAWAASSSQTAKKNLWATPRSGSHSFGCCSFAAEELESSTEGSQHPSPGHCGSCWAFSATGALEGLVFNRTGKLVVLSEQNLIDCSRKLGNNGCQGGYMTRAFQYVRDNGGLNSEHVYPYTATDSSSCRYNPQDRAANCSAIWLVAQGSEAALEQAVAAVGPVSVAVDASSFHFHFYKSGTVSLFMAWKKKSGLAPGFTPALLFPGIFSSIFCSQRVNHGMLAVGYGTSQEYGRNVSYWILKNSWSEVWGEQGYIRLLKGANNQCGVANQASFPVL